MKTKILIFTWFVALSVPLAYMMGMHSVPMKEASVDKFLAIKNKETLVYHFLGADCGCSESVVESLLKRNPQKSYKEKIFILGKNEKWFKDLSAKGYELETESMDYYEKKFNIVAVPQLVAVKNGKIFYTGGYSAKRNPSSEDIEDQKIIKNAFANYKEKYPIFGCVNGNKNRKLTDPISLKYK